jgi:Flp pilus assembly protein TadG
MKRKNPERSGTAVVELAVCLPVIFAIVFASIEACNMVALKQIISQSAYDGALQALRSDAEEADVIARINAVLAARNVTPSNVVIGGAGGAGYDSLGHGDTVTVTVEAETNGNVVGPQLFGFAKVLSSTATAIKQ